MRVSFDGQTKGSCEAEVSQLYDSPSRVNEQVLRLEISVEYSVGVEIDQRLQDLVEEALHLTWRQRSSLCLQILLQIKFKVLKDEIKRFFRVQYFLESTFELVTSKITPQH